MNNVYEFVELLNLMNFYLSLATYKLLLNRSMPLFHNLWDSACGQVQSQGGRDLLSEGGRFTISQATWIDLVCWCGRYLHRDYLILNTI